MLLVMILFVFFIVYRNCKAKNALSLSIESALRLPASVLLGLWRK